MRSLALTGPFTLEGYGRVDIKRADEAARIIAARIVSDNDPKGELREVFRRSQSTEYTRFIAEEAAGIVVMMLLAPNEVVISVVPLIARHLTAFMSDARRVLVLGPPPPAH